MEVSINQGPNVVSGGLGSHANLVPVPYQGPVHENLSLQL